MQVLHQHQHQVTSSQTMNSQVMSRRKCNQAEVKCEYRPATSDEPKKKRGRPPKTTPALVYENKQKPT